MFFANVREHGSHVQDLSRHLPDLKALGDGFAFCFTSIELALLLPTSLLIRCLFLPSSSPNHRHRHEDLHETSRVAARAAPGLRRRRRVLFCEFHEAKSALFRSISSLVITHFATNSVSIGGGDGNENDESAYRYILSKARECAFNDAATAAEAQRFLRQILELESGCASGNLAGHDICDNVGELAVVVAHLREKVEANTVLTSHDVHAARTMAGLVAVSMAFAILAEVQWHDDVTPFTVQEWLWAIKGGYLPTMVMHFIRNGGL